jgi:hypothetical protein
VGIKIYRLSMEKLHNFIERVSEKKEKLYKVKEGGEKTESELFTEYDNLDSTTQAMISFEGYCALRKKMN